MKFGKVNSANNFIEMIVLVTIFGIELEMIVKQLEKNNV